ncbi:hypothetical protein COX85_02840 [Candidatus Micrarchaeota archaeon CG_4_10_14_0_2_um_filter_55_9]|nr:MAG: hypothetical protein AUJ15_01935 [Candidatus Micrarchaeota archaeon CG1_02_55_41]PIO03317.1 MAG: hypothetical protein COT57_00755 [Candidatus Micrarchaeota archaeon CG09_land_8_20_14_0_10_55_25]PIZ91635.1 MAG: hypothetical protein COX85_02840 [Candidatus Micrarchaeota archaeon CG_4_10_14_0_2_um_filter_55_9]PJD00899.1 MAG: hypothetical protein COU38_03915 [Candidatus Micrarchaeota archaeon CG10_big_fil_rev_8_21_14_0_10_54_18]
MKERLLLFLAGALLLGVAAGYWFGGSQAESDYAVKLSECGEKLSELEGQVDYLQKGPGMALPSTPTSCPPGCGPEQWITAVNLRFDEYEEGKELESRSQCDTPCDGHFCCVSTEENTKYYEWGYHGTNLGAPNPWYGGNVRVVSAPQVSGIAKGVDRGISESTNNVLFFSAHHSDRPVDSQNQGGNRVIRYFGQRLKNVEIDFDFMVPSDYENENEELCLVRGPYEEYGYFNGSQNGTFWYDATEVAKSQCKENNEEDRVLDAKYAKCVLDAKWVQWMVCVSSNQQLMLFGEDWNGNMIPSSESEDRYNVWHQNGVRLNIHANRHAVQPNTIWSYGGNGTIKLANYQPDKWYHATITVDSEKEEYTVSISGETSASLPYNVNPEDGNIDEISQIVVGALGSDQENDADLYFDNFVVRGKCYDKP